MDKVILTWPLDELNAFLFERDGGLGIHVSEWDASLNEWVEIHFAETHDFTSLVRPFLDAGYEQRLEQ